MKSIRSKLLVLFMLTLALALLAGGYLTWRTAREEAAESMDYQLRQMTVALFNGNFAEMENGVDPEEDAQVQVQIFSQADGRTLYRSNRAVQLPLLHTLGYGRIYANNQRWRVYSVTREGRLFELAQPMAVRDEIASKFAFNVIKPFLWLLPVMAAMIWLIVGQGLAPLIQLASWVKRQYPEDMAHYPQQGLPSEIEPLAVAINQLLDRLSHAFTSQRRFIADAAHELRTPLAALTLQLELNERATDAHSQAQSWQDVKAGVARIQHVVEQLLQLAHSEPGGDHRMWGRVSLREMVRNVLSQHIIFAESKHIDLGVVAEDESAQVWGDVVSLSMLLSNLVSNAVRYTPPGGRVDIATGTDTQGHWLRITDTGPGIPAEERTRVFNRFYRIPGSTEHGTGLGLSIVKAIAEQHQASIHLEESFEHGLQVTVRFSLVD